MSDEVLTIHEFAVYLKLKENTAYRLASEGKFLSCKFLKLNMLARSFHRRKIMRITNISSLPSFIWAISDLLRGTMRPSQYREVIIPFTLLRRLECVFEERKKEYLAGYNELKDRSLSLNDKQLILKKLGIFFYNSSDITLSALEDQDIKHELEHYINSFSHEVRELFEHFQFSRTLEKLSKSNLLTAIVKKFSALDLRPVVISDNEMSLAFEELLRLLAENSAESMGEHFTPRDIVNLTTNLVLSEEDEKFSQAGVIKTIYDPTLGTGGFLSAATDLVASVNPEVIIAPFGQELSPESYAIAKSIAFIRGQNPEGIKLGNTLTTDLLEEQKFDYILANPPFGSSWKPIHKLVKHEHSLKGGRGRYGPGLPRISDATLLFVLHSISKLKIPENGGGRIGIIVNSASLFSGDAGSGESEIRRFLLDNDLIEAIVALPQNMFYNTGVQPYILVVNNNKQENRKGKIQLINAREFGLRLKKSIGAKTTELDHTAIAEILNTYTQSITNSNSKIIANTEFYYRKIKVKLNKKTMSLKKSL